MGRRVIRLGDPTTHGGKVVSATTGYIMFGKEVAGRGDKVTCPRPGHGVVTIVEGDPVWTVNGKNVALEGHKCSCGCSLISTLPNVVRSYEGEGTEATWKGAGAASALLGSNSTPRRSDQEAFNDIYQLLDEKTGEPLAGFEYAIQRADGKLVYGVTDSSGFTQKIGDTDFAEDISFSLGD